MTSKWPWYARLFAYHWNLCLPYFNLLCRKKHPHLSCLEWPFLPHRAHMEPIPSLLLALNILLTSSETNPPIKPLSEYVHWWEIPGLWVSILIFFSKLQMSVLCDIFCSVTVFEAAAWAPLWPLLWSGFNRSTVHPADSAESHVLPWVVCQVMKVRF
jgi:hypothetical protein